MQRRPWTGRLLLAVSLTAMAPLAAPALTAGAAPAPETAEGTAAAHETAALPVDQLTAATTEVATGLTRPTAIAAPDDGTGRLFITEKSGTVRVYEPATGLAAEPLLDITDQVDSTYNERGLLGIAPAPDYAESQALYLAYTAAADSAVTLARYSVADGTLEPLISQEHATYDNHNGGQLAFGSDGFLYWSIGDGGGNGDPEGNGQSLDTLLGKILRVDVGGACGDLPYCVPEDNPFVDNPEARPEIWAYGLRNAWRFSFDPADGSQWIADVGQGRSEEINHVPADRAGANYGWSCREGGFEFNPDECAPGVELTEPVFVYPTAQDGNCAVIGGNVYRGQEYADLADGTYVATDYCSNNIWALRPEADGGYSDAVIGEMPTQVTAFGAAADGELYVVNDLPGQLFRVSFGQAATE
ncbi:PQQ-dependent sugar dehydrogenase [Streptomyces radicis]|uniref:Glucose/sorbosone dehydrogenase-like protein n=1 Tax=Streptomyces radicis TaxID=1750517 RepID=A0A3A9WLV0_9ACTN|nr:PQQ-dependent sugar dehydrogenase [Streptomyces radicis]RKN10444.1 glucose/sorbosone dehydrogenase-like protein [Streptomyces radicis]RKN24703.1 glucose/sorbosone dehydrogenase-like protein [Streptomyces radicis]